MPLVSSWRECEGQQCNYQLLSNIGGKVADVALTMQSHAETEQLKLAIHGVQLYGVVTNQSVVPTRVECRLIYIPNYNQYTDDAVDYLNPRFTMFSKSGQGVNGLQYRGYNKTSLVAYDATSPAIKFQTLDRKVLYLPGTGMHGTVGNPVQAILMSTPAIYKRFSLAKYFKKPKLATVRGSATELQNGNYFFVWWGDGAVTQQKYNLLATANLQYSIKQTMLDDTAP